MAGRTLTIDIQTKDQQTLAALKRLQKEVKGLDGDLDKTSKSGLSLGNALGGLAVGAGLKYAADQASDLNEATNVTGLIFKDARGEIDEFVKSSADLGFSEAQARELTGSIGSLLLNLGLAQDDTVQWSKDLLALGADMGSAFNEDPADAVEAIGAAIRGETEPIRRFGVTLDDASVRAKAVEMGLAGTAAQVDKTAKAQATLALITEQTSAVQGDFAATSDEAAGAQRKAKANFDNAAAALGKSLTPAIAEAAGAVSVLSQGFASVPGPVRDTALGLGLLAIGAKKLETRVSESSYSLGSLSKSLTGVDKALIGTTAGVASFTATMQILEAMASSGIDVSGLTEDIIDLGDGTATTRDVLDTVGTDIDGLADAFKRADGAPDGFAEGLGKLITNAASDPGLTGLRKAQNTVSDLDEALANAASSGNAEGAAAAYDLLVQALYDAGLKYDQIIPLLPKYTAEAERAERATGDVAVATSEAEDATEGWLGTNSDMVQGWKDQAAATSEANDELATNISLIGDAADAQSSYTGSVYGVEDAQAKLNEARKSGDQDEIERAELDLTEAMNRQVDAAVKLAEKNAEVEGKTLSAAEAAMIQKAEYEKARDATGEWNDDLQRTVDLLTLASAEYKTKVDTSQAKSDLEDFNNTLQVTIDHLDKLNLGSTLAGLSGPYGDPSASPVTGGRGRGPGGDVAAPRRIGGDLNIIANNLTSLSDARTMADAIAKADRHAARLRRVS